MRCKTCKEEGIFLPFRRELKPGDSNFSLDVPNYRRRDGYEFWFDRLELGPGFVDEAAHNANLDRDELLEQKLYTMHLNVAARYTKRTAENFVEPLFLEVPVKYTAADLVDTFAKHFEEKRMDVQCYCPAFFDWVILDKADNVVPDLNTYVSENYSTYFDETAVQKEMLPPSVTLEDTGMLNHFSLPATPHLIPNFRLRLHVMPNADLVVRANAAVVVSLGFDLDQFEEENIAGKHKLYRLRNSNSTIVRSLVAKRPPDQYLAQTNRGSVIFELRPTDFQSPSMPILVSEKMLLGSSDQLMREVNRALVQLGRYTNTKLRLSYNANEEKYQFSFPSNFLVNVEYRLPQAVAEALGFFNTGTETELVTRSVVGRRFHSFFKDPHFKAKTLTHDTGQVLVVQDGVSAFNLHCHNDSLVAYLLPNGKGQLELAKLACFSPSLSLAGQAMSSEKPDHTTVSFSLLQVRAGGMKRLDWPCHSVLDAVVVGWPCACLR